MTSETLILTPTTTAASSSFTFEPRLPLFKYLTSSQWGFGEKNLQDQKLAGIS
jgi:hypothetical protein